MMKKRKILFLVIMLIIITEGIISIFILHQTGLETDEDDEGTNEEYIAIFLDNREDFEYIAEIMRNWSSEKIVFNNGIPQGTDVEINERFLCSSQDITDEIISNEEFCNHLNNLYDLNEIKYIIFEERDKQYEGDVIVFILVDFPVIIMVAYAMAQI